MRNWYFVLSGSVYAASLSFLGIYVEYYKYLPPDRIDVLEKLKIRFTQAMVLNDPFEVFPAVIDESEEWFRNRFLEIIRNDTEQQQFRNPSKGKQYFRARKKEFPEFYRYYTDKRRLVEKAYSVVMLDAHVQGYLSLSKTDKNVLMWSHYASNHEGFLIGFDANHEYFDFGVTEIKYSNKRPFFDPFQARQDASLFHTKSEDWTYEEEVRKSIGFVEPVLLENGNNLLPYPEILPQEDDPVYSEVRLFDYPKDAVKSITFGWKSTMEIREKILSLLKLNDLLGVQVRQVSPHPSKYEMVVNKIDF